MNGQSPLYALAALILAIGLAAGGWLIGQGFPREPHRGTLRHGQGDVGADGQGGPRAVADPLAVAPRPGNDLGTGAGEAREGRRRRSGSCYRPQGLTEKDIELQRLDVTDLLAQAYR